ncbi:hypothetical protein PMAYCL1PPCAC_20331, partial [Pristionchus mayeri]
GAAGRASSGRGQRPFTSDGMGPLPLQRHLPAVYDQGLREGAHEDARSMVDNVNRGRRSDVREGARPDRNQGHSIHACRGTTRLIRRCQLISKLIQRSRPDDAVDVRSGEGRDSGRNDLWFLVVSRTD